MLYSLPAIFTVVLIFSMGILPPIEIKIHTDYNTPGGRVQGRLAAEKQKSPSAHRIGAGGDEMGRYCFSGGRWTKTVGCALMAAGLIVLLVTLPGWMWATITGIAIISVGFLLWRFG
jgi:hypothetical protein